MKTPQDFMPPIVLLEQTHPEVGRYVSYEDLVEWYDTKLKPLFESGVVMYSDHAPFDLNNEEYADMSPGKFINSKFCFLAIGIESRDQAVTKEELLKVLRTEAKIELNKGRESFFNTLADRIEKWGVKS